MKIRYFFWLLFLLSLAACAPLTAEISRDVATTIGTEIHVQVGTAAVKQVATAVATHYPAATSQSELARAAYDCARRYCKNMTECAEAVYKLNACGHSNLDSDGDGIPCETLCKNKDINAIEASFAKAAPADTEASQESGEEIGWVTRVIDGDTIDVRLGDKTVRIRYVQTNTPERDEPCFRESTQANADLVANKMVRLLPSKRAEDPFGRLLRFVYVGDVNVERVLVEQGFAEVVLYPPNDAHFEEFKQLEQEAAAAGRGCHPTGIFDDGTYTR